MDKIKTKIVCTIGPATWTPEVLNQLIKNGMTVARINASFADAPEIEKVTKLIRSVSDDVAVMLDLKGHKIRISDIGEPRELKAGQELILDTDPNSQEIVVSYENLHKDIKVGAQILIDDGKIHLDVKEIRGTQIICTVKNSAVLKRLKTVNTPGTYLTFDPLTEKDKVDIEAGKANQVDFIAGSFIRDLNDVLAIKERIAGTDIKLIAKIEDPLGVKNFDDILKEVDGIMVARGDLGVELPFEQIPMLQKQFIQRCNEVGKIVIVATHMLESMIINPAATRAEISDVANAICDGTDAIMTSAETSTGNYPIEAISTMHTVAGFTEPTIETKMYEGEIARVREYNDANDDDIAESAITIAKSAAEACRNLPIKAVLMLTNGGFTARMIARHKIKQPIYAFVPTRRIARKLAFTRGVYAYEMPETATDRDTLMNNVIEAAKKDNLVSSGDLVAIVIGANTFTDSNASLLELHKIG